MSLFHIHLESKFVRNKKIGRDGLKKQKKKKDTNSKTQKDWYCKVFGRELTFLKKKKNSVGENYGRDGILYLARGCRY